ncbi:MAG: twin-arginine translocase TatA/TatE family subunit [Spirochaetaceae bacterium]
MLGTTEIVVIGGVVVLLFGASAIPKFAKNLGKAKKEFRDGIAEEADGEKPPKDDSTAKTEKEE